MTIYKTTAAALLLLGAATVWTGCGDSQLKTAAEVVNSQCPMQLGQSGEIKSVIYEDSVVTYYYQLNEQFYDMQVLSQNPDASREDMKVLFSDVDANMKELLRLAIEERTPIRVQFSGAQSGITAAIKLSLDELRELLASNNASPAERLERAVAESNAGMPVEMGCDLTIERMLIDGDNVLYVYKINNTVADLKQLTANMESAREEIRRSIHDTSESDPAYRSFMAIVAKAGKNLGYRYVVGSDDNFQDVIISNAELCTVLHLN